MTERALHPVNERPLGGFSQEPISFITWLEPIDESTEFDWEGVFGTGRANSPAFRLSARDPRVGRGIADIEDSIFDKAEGGLDRGMRELAALTTSRLNGCLFCVSYHSRGTRRFTGEIDGVERIVAEGVGSEQSPEWRAVMDASVALASTPPTFDETHVERLRAIGFDEAMVMDLIHSIGYFSSANRFLLSTGEPFLA